MSINKDAQKAPNLRFKGFTDAWEQRKLGNFSEITKLAGFEFTQFVQYSDAGKTIALRGLNIKNGKLHLENIKYIDGSDFSKLNRSKLFKDDLVFTYVGTVGEVALIPENEKYYLAPNVSVIRVIDSVSPNYLLHYFRREIFYNKEIFPLIATSSQPALSMVNIRKFNIKFPDNKIEQINIAQLFNTFDNTITLHQRKLEQLKQLKEALLQQMFPGKGETVPKLRFAGFEGDWEERKLGEISKIKTGSSDLQDADATGNYPFFVRSENIERSNRFLFEGEAILIPGEGRLGEIYHYINGKFDYHQRVYKISNFSDYNVQGLFVLYYLKKNFKRHALKYTVKATVDSLRLPTLLEFNIMVPNNEEQQHISNLLNGLEKLIQANENKINDLKSLKTVLLQNMFI